MSQWVVCIENVLWHAVRMDNNTDAAPWQNNWGNVMDQVGPAPGTGRIIDVKCDEDKAGNLQLIIRTSEGRIWHTVRYYPSGLWQNFWGDVFVASEMPFFFTTESMTCSAGTDGTFQIGILLKDLQTVLHTVRNVDGTWQKSWENVTLASAAGPLPGLVTAVPPPAPYLFAGG